MSLVLSRSRNWLRYWPYDELTVEKCLAVDHFRFSSPWLTAEVGFSSQYSERVSAVVEKWKTEGLAPNDIEEVSWLFSAVSHYPFAYILPEARRQGLRDHHTAVDPSLAALRPDDILAVFRDQTDAPAIPSSLSWTWDTDAAMAFSALDRDGRDNPGCMHDPRSLFSVAQRYHLLESVEHNKMSELLLFMRSLSSRPQAFQKASALVVRQNHYATQKCQDALEPALEIAQSVRPQVQAFIQAERGHDVLLSRALQALGVNDVTTLPVLAPSRVVMELFRWIAKRNFLAFAIVVNIFERGSWMRKDPLTTLLSEHGFEAAAHHLDVHRTINESGGHENVALGFINQMGPVNRTYATEALRLAELTTRVFHQISSDLLEEIKQY